MRYRERLLNIDTIESEDDIETENYTLTLEYLNDIIDDIECVVREIRDKLEEIQGITEIEELKEIVNKLAYDLY